MHASSHCPPHCTAKSHLPYPSCTALSARRYHRVGVPTYGLYLRASERGRFLDLLRAYPQQDIRVGGVGMGRWADRQAHDT